MTEQKEFNVSLDAPELRRIEVSGFNGEVNIAASKKVNISSVIHGIEGLSDKDLQKAQTRVELLGDTLSISPSFGFKLPGRKTPSADLTLTMPSDLVLDVRTSGGYSSVKSMQGAVSIDLNGGDLLATDLSGELNLSIRVGKSRLEYSTGTANITMWGGELLVARKTPWASGQALNITGPGGEVTLEIPDDSNLTFEASTVLGSIDTEINWDRTETKGGVGSYFKGVMGNGDALIKISSAKTTVTLRQPQEGG